REEFSIEEMIELFTLDRVNKAPASFDPRKLLACQNRSFSKLSTEERIEKVKPFAQRAGLLNDPKANETLTQVIQEADDRLTIAGDILDFDYFFIDTYEVDSAAVEKRIRKDEAAPGRLLAIAERLESIDLFHREEIQEVIQDFCNSESIKLRAIIHALRVATTGRTNGFGMFETLEILGKTRSIERLKLAGTIAN
ncbi:MAG: glutamate--tRNA ligase, partial [Planctomycetota bacterium]|nr:glutamate--tRNA ligase [Planctomycetota bacterium]